MGPVRIVDPPYSLQSFHQWKIFPVVVVVDPKTTYDIQKKKGLRKKRESKCEFSIYLLSISD